MKRKKASQKQVIEMVKEFFIKNPEAKELLTDNADGMLFSKDLRDALQPMGHMDVKDALKSPDFWHALCRHAGMSDEQFEEILNNQND